MQTSTHNLLTSVSGVVASMAFKHYEPFKHYEIKNNLRNFRLKIEEYLRTVSFKSNLLVLIKKSVQYFNKNT